MTQYIDGDYLVTETGGTVIRELNRPAPAVASRILSRVDFRGLFTQNEKIAIYNAATTNVQIRIWLDDLQSADQVDLDSPRTIAGVQGLEALTLIGVGRAAEILGG